MTQEEKVLFHLNQLISTLDSINQPIRNNQLLADVNELHEIIGIKLNEKIIPYGISMDSGII
ncbi:hypothetical protein I1A41_16680 [Pectobacterium carotovorum]|uniref:Uncharacterized protein n=1 Tax=Pectobacterium aquaticum TaxID=2204145 RepID=A0A426JG91_9GAMM|nr:MULTISPECIES: hypothetical protein [Pectobacterium]MCH4997835.1 hypothetical protein [Pectobacterium carotovorum]RRO12089.1 hypothetical protein DMB85_001370 [Pectobacterium aquaticum]